jgi:cell division protein ZapA
MPEVSVEIAGKKYRMACEEGEEPHLLDLAAELNRRIEGFKGSFGEIGDARLTVMAAIAVVDELADAERRVEALSVEIAEVTASRRNHADEIDALKRDFAERLSETARRVESIAGIIDETGSPPPMVP